jgi:hypothetical protein
VFAGGEGLSGLSVCVRALLRERADNVLKTNDCIDCLIRGWTPLFIHNEGVHRHPLGGVMSIRKETPPHSEKVSLP